ncbi:4Fe-4S dicluster domain-containing protein [Chloroflexota bacterium]
MKKMDLNAGTFRKRTLSPPPEVAKPTYGIVGPLERVDVRLRMFYRDRMAPNTPDYDSFYGDYPELETIDSQRKQARCKKLVERIGADPVNTRLSGATFYAVGALARPKLVDGALPPRSTYDIPGHEGRPNIDPRAMSQKVKALGLYLGAAKVRIAPANRDWAYTHYTLSPEEDLKKHKYIICLAVPQDVDILSEGLGNAQGMEVGKKYAISGLISNMLAYYIRSLGFYARALPPGNSPYLNIPTFVDAGIGEVGRCGFVVSKEFGNSFRAGGVATDMPLVVDRPVDFGLQDFCSKCQICATACPPGAISKEGKTIRRGISSWHADTTLCRRYWDSIGSSCSICQIVCPWNHSNTWFHNIIRQESEKAPYLRRLIISGEKLFYKNRLRPEPEWARTTAVKID